jgi:hypothetical protein
MLTLRRTASRPPWPGVEAGPAFQVLFSRQPVRPPLTRPDEGRLQPRTSHLLRNLEVDVRLDDLPLCILQLDVVAHDEAVFVQPSTLQTKGR